LDPIFLNNSKHFSRRPLLNYSLIESKAGKTSKIGCNHLN
jgi:hypothetical protein